MIQLVRLMVSGYHILCTLATLGTPSKHIHTPSQLTLPCQKNTNLLESIKKTIKCVVPAHYWINLLSLHINTHTKPYSTTEKIIIDQMQKFRRMDVFFTITIEPLYQIHLDDIRQRDSRKRSHQKQIMIYVLIPRFSEIPV